MEERLKSWITTISGIVLLVGSVVGWSIDWFTDYQAVAAGVIAIILLYMKDTLILNIGKLFVVLIDAIKKKLGV